MKLASYIRSFDSIEQIGIEEWNEIAGKSENPYYLYGFIEQFFKSAKKFGGKPLFLVCFDEQEIVGIAPILINSWKGIFRTANFLTGPDFDPDFVIKEEHREPFLHNVIDFLFKNVGCNLVDISLPSKNLCVLKNASESLGAHHLISSIEGHSVLHVEETWAEFEKRRGRNFKKFFRSIERKMEQSGTWKVVFTSKQSSTAKICEDILEIEKLSWKQDYRTQRGVKQDEGLLQLLTGAFNSSLETGFRWQVAFLEVNGQNIAYSFWYEYKDTAFICKTSFNSSYKKYYPGVYINNAVVREIFNNPEIKQIDFMTALPFHARWEPKIIPRFRLIISKSHIPIVITKALQNRYGLLVYRVISRATNLVLPF